MSRRPIRSISGGALTTTSLALLCAALAVAVSGVDRRVVFDLRPAGYDQSVKAFASGTRDVEVDPRSPNATTPFILPGPADQWAGGTAHTLRLRLPELPAGDLLLVLDAAATHDAVPPLLSLAVDHELVGIIRTSKGTGMPPREGAPTARSQYRVKIPRAHLALLGDSVLSVSNDAGSWIMFDRLRLVETDRRFAWSHLASRTPLPSPGAALLALSLGIVLSSILALSRGRRRSALLAVGAATLLLVAVHLLPDWRTRELPLPALPRYLWLALPWALVVAQFQLLGRIRDGLATRLLDIGRVPREDKTALWSPARRLAFLGIFGAGVVLRTLSLWPLSLDYQDEALNGLAALHILQGHWPVFTYGQPFMGALGNYLTAPFLLVASPLSGLKAHAVLTSIALVPLLTLLGARTYGPKAAFYVGALAAVPPPLLFSFAHRHRFDHTSVPLLGAALLLVAVALFDAPRTPASRRCWLVLGLLGGVAFWTNFLAVYFLLPVAALLWLKDLRAPLRGGSWLALVGFGVGSLPFWLYNATHQLRSLWFLTEVTAGHRTADLLLGFVQVGFPKVTVGPVQIFEHVLPRAPGWPLALVFWALALIYATLRLWVRRARAVGIEASWREGLPLAVFATVVALNVTTGFGQAMIDQDARYLLGLYAVLPLLGGLLLRDLERIQPALASGAFAGLVVFNAVGGLIVRPPTLPSLVPQTEHDLRLAEELAARGFGRAYWESGKNATFLSRGRVILAHPYQEDHVRSALEVDGASRVAFVANTPSHFLHEPLEVLETNLRAIGAGFRRDSVVHLPLFADFRPFPLVLQRLAAGRWRIETQPDGGDGAGAIADGDLGTRWSTDRPRQDGDRVTVWLDEITLLAGLTILPGSHTDLPTGYRLELSPDGHTWEEVVHVPRYLPMFFSGSHPMLKARRGRLEARWPPRPAQAVRMTHVGTDSRYPWSIHELFLYTPGAGEPRGTSAVADLVRFLEARRIRYVYADAWLAAAVLVASQNRIRAETTNMWDDDYAWPPMGSETRDLLTPGPDRAIVVETGDAAQLRGDLGGTAFTWQESAIGEFTVFHSLAIPVPPRSRLPRDRWQIAIGQWHETSGLANEGASPSRLVAGPLPPAGLSIQIDLGEVRRPRQLELRPGESSPETLGALSVEGSLNGQEWRPLSIRWGGPVVWWGQGLLRLANRHHVLQLDGVPARFLRLSVAGPTPPSSAVVKTLAVFE